MIRALIIIILFFVEFMQAQDVHYSQFEKTKALINPSLIANQNNDYQIDLQRRSQWSSVTTPFNTFSLSFNIKEFYKGFYSGATILSDVAGDSRFSTDGLLVSLGNKFKIKENDFSVGLQTSFYQRSVSYDNLIFLENEELQNTKFSFFDIGLGVSNYRILDENSAFVIGFSCYHLNKPKQSLTSDKEVFLRPKYIMHATYYTKVNLKIKVSPAAYFSSQSKEKEFVVGTGATYLLDDKVQLISGIYRRFEDAFFITLGMKKENLEAIISYDINTSTLANASGFMGGFEFSISYGWSVFKENKEKKQEVCPKYL